MFNRWIHPQAHAFLHILGLCVLAVGLPLNKVLMSIGAIWGVANLVIEGNYSDYWKNLKSNRFFWLVASFFILEIIGLAWTSNFEYGFDDLRKKLPIIAIPLAIFARGEISKRNLNILFTCFISSVLFCSLWNYISFTQNTSNVKTDSREMSVFISHIRFSMMVVISLLLSVHLIFKYKRSLVVLLPVVIWYVYYTFYSQVLTGVLSLLAIVFGALHYYLFSNKIARFTLFSLPFVLFALLLVFLGTMNTGLQDYPVADQLKEKTIQGNEYTHDLNKTEVEQGRFVFTNICDLEIRQEWPKRSSIHIDSVDLKGQFVRYSLYRYLTYLNLPKDSLGISKLSEKDISAIEMGYATPEHKKWGLNGRIADLRYQIENNKDPNGHSMLQRFEYWNAGLQIIQEHLLFGVGTGDVNDTFQSFYDRTKSKLLPEYRLRAHNTYLTQTATYGILGFILLLALFWKSLKHNFSEKRLFMFCITWVFFLTFFTEDTLETQAGVSLFGLFIGLIGLQNLNKS